MILDNNEHGIWLELIIIHKLRNFTKAVFVTKNYANAKLCVVMKMVRVFVKNKRPPTVLILEKK